MEQGGALTEQVSTSRRKNSGSKGAEMRPGCGQSPVFYPAVPCLGAYESACLHPYHYYHRYYYHHYYYHHHHYL